MKREEEINKIIKEEKLDTNLISDGYHTFGELYEHRIILFIVLAAKVSDIGHNEWPDEVWRSKVHSDGTSWEGWFILGIRKTEGQQITYHLPISYWDKTDFAETIEKAPEWDGHTPKDVIERLLEL